MFRRVPWPSLGTICCTSVVFLELSVRNKMVDASWDIAALAVFGLVLLATFAAAWKGHRDAGDEVEAQISRQRLNRWLVGLSAGATANSGFVVTGAVGLGYSYGIHWLLLPFGWFLGYLVCWQFFPHRINSFGRRAKATTLADLIIHGLPVGRHRVIAVASTVIVVVCLGGYTMAQWVAGQKFVQGAFGVSGYWTLLLFAVFIIAYSSVGRFRGSVYADTFQAITRLLGTTIALFTVCWFVAKNPSTFAANINDAGDGFLDLLGGGTAVSAAGMVIGYAAAAFGFGLGQPQVTSRYLAARSPRETRAARWIYMAYVQVTWATMTVFGVLLRGVMPEIADPEQGLTVFVSATLPPLLMGVIVADIFGAIASTANSLLVAMTQATRDLFGAETGDRIPFWCISLPLGLVTMLAAITLQERTTVFDLAITSVSLMAAGLAPAVAVKVLYWRHSSLSITAAMFVGFAVAFGWKVAGWSATINEAAAGISVGFVANFLLSRRCDLPRPLFSKQKRPHVESTVSHGPSQDNE